LYSGYKLGRLRLFSFCGYELAHAALTLVVFGAYESYPKCFVEATKSLSPWRSIAIKLKCLDDSFSNKGLLS